ncbi:hypothetical protein ASG95_09030 [Phycicoccus sp. Soil803]|nr:hypothetical protein ASG95_09030 [Phycicoccus sp. Soil803]
MSSASVPTMFSVGEQAAVRGAFELADYVGELNMLPLDSGDEVCFVLAQADLLSLTGDIRVLEQVLQQVVGRKVWVLASVDGETVPFG